MSMDSRVWLRLSFVECVFFIIGDVGFGRYVF